MSTPPGDEAWFYAEPLRNRSTEQPPSKACASHADSSQCEWVTISEETARRAGCEEVADAIKQGAELRVRRCAQSK